ncbi:PTS glucose transporter subunit IIA [Virgibacillus halodenitrificans]|uniref:PTS sugar transporter subunit IIA n=1 Tax=Virgibacillus halodenitrificans TaxID=1482 RepID=UPI0024C0292A|nr:PTS glucose transporter subunit IIA [Virgibacillus halodenitrificans]WHX26465.1 PTS glucose transporter subunit IIA [Virgibacillus halodenitrificans]
MFKKLFSKSENNTKLSLIAPLDGEVLSLEEVPDPVFAEKMMGDGMAIKPSSSTVHSPIQGKVMQVFPTKHAIGLQAENGAEILIHIGLETVNLKGEGFEVFVKEGDSVKVGDKLVQFDMQIIEQKAASTITPIIITNTADMGEIKKTEKKQVVAGQDEVMVVDK